ncbi:MAG: DUF1080 domain-containing protein [Pirellulales bacterium]|nr:DUF1080 domain-containing protein [Pirellulales bacterium]
MRCPKLSTTPICFFAALSFIQSSIADDKTIELFNGKSLDGWTTQSGAPVTKGWVVKDGMLVRKSRGGAIYTKDEYGDFDLRFEWKIDKGGNSGIKYRVAFYKKGVRGRPGWLGGEYQIYGDKNKSRGVHSAGALYGLFAPNEKKKLRPADEFNESRIVVRGSHIEHWLNGEKIVEADVDSDEWKKRIAKSKFNIVPGFFQNPKGRIQIQDHGAPVSFRNITLREL